MSCFLGYERSRDGTPAILERNRSTVRVNARVRVGTLSAGKVRAR